MPHSGIGIVSFSIACLTSILILAMWAAIHLRRLSNQMDAILFLVAGVLTFSAALIAFIGLFDRGFRRDFVFCALILVIVNFLALALLGATLPAT